MKRAKPVRYIAVDTCDKVRRNVFCRNYAGCLDYAILRKWPGFSCDNCGCYEQEKLDGQALSEDYARCVALAYVSGAFELNLDICA
jgi:hypothetical protein